MEYSIMRGHIKAKTDKAFLFTVCNDTCLLLNGQEHWLPMEYVGVCKAATFEYICVPEWLYARKTGMSIYKCNNYLHHQFREFYRDETKLKEFYDDFPK